MTEPLWLLERTVLQLHIMLLAEHGGAGGVRDMSLLTSALDRPKNQFSYKSSISIFDLAAAYSFGIARNHPFVDGNKRTAFVSGALFLEINGYELTAPEPDVVVTFQALADGSIKEKKLAQWFALNSASLYRP
ncbi:MAG: type II toxin-antitoxin system death-on-curing family toxin [Pseudomonadota bacterium]